MAPLLHPWRIRAPEHSPYSGLTLPDPSPCEMLPGLRKGLGSFSTPFHSFEATASSSGVGVSHSWGSSITLQDLKQISISEPNSSLTAVPRQPTTTNSTHSTQVCRDPQKLRATWLYPDPQPHFGGTHPAEPPTAPLPPQAAASALAGPSAERKKAHKHLLKEGLPITPLIFRASSTTNGASASLGTMPT